jgi:hypothetical protein
MKVQFIGYKNEEYDIADCDVKAAFKIAMKYLKDNNKKTTPAVRFWAEDDGHTVVLDYGSHSEFVKFKGTTEEVAEFMKI